MAVRTQIPGGPVDDRREVRAMIEIEPPQEVLVGLTAAGMLNRHHAGHGFEQLGDTQHGPDQ